MYDEFADVHKCQSCEKEIESGKTKYFNPFIEGYFCSEPCMHKGMMNRDEDIKEKEDEADRKVLKDFLAEPRARKQKIIARMPLTGEPIDEVKKPDTSQHPWRR